VNADPRRNPTGRELLIRLPDWLPEALPPEDAAAAAERRMQLAVELAGANVRRGTGGPFAAVVFEIATGRLLAAAVNVVLPSRCCLAHAETLALGIAQQRIGSHDLSVAEGGAELVTSVEPCGMCLGAVAWSGVGRLVCGARETDATAVGFDEGPKPADWPGALAARGIEIVRDVLRDEARAVLAEYARRDGVIYNGRGETGRKRSTS
jgi:tRNA(Arg) A34 adenosine deaminase TadA